MRAGTGVTHSGYNHSKVEPVHFLQIWIVPDARGLKPAYGQLAFDREAALEDGEREPHRPGTLVVLQSLGPIELFADVVGHFLVEVRFAVGQPVRHRIRDALGEERRAVELEQVLLDHAPHQVGDICRVHTVPEPSLEAVAVEEGHEQLKVLLLAVMRRGRQQQKVPRERREELPEAIPPSGRGPSTRSGSR